MRELILRSLGPADLEAAAVIHCAAFTDSLLTKLGKEAVCRYYRWLLTGPHQIHAIGAVRDGRLAGYLFGGVAPQAIEGFVRTNLGLLLRCLARRPWLAISPGFRTRLGPAVAALTYRSHETSAADELSISPSAWPFDVISIAVDPHDQRKGVGSRLMREAEAIARGNGFGMMTLVVRVTNVNAIRFYESLGWRKFVEGGIWRGNMELSFINP